MRRIERTGVPAETRRMLRERLSRFLPVSSTPTGHLQYPVRPQLSDGEIVQLFQNLELIPGDAIASARVLYEQAARAQRAAEATAPNESANSFSNPPQDPSGPAPETMEPTLVAPDQQPTDNPTSIPLDQNTDRQSGRSPGVPVSNVRVFTQPPSLTSLSPPPAFEQLVEQGWIRTSWDRFSVPKLISMAVLKSSPSIAPAFRRLVEIRARDNFRLKEGCKPSTVAYEVALGILTGRRQPGEVDCVSRAWIAARLWDTAPQQKGTENAAQRLGDWVDRWVLLNWPAFALSTVLEPASMDAFVEAALSVLTAPGASPGWEEFRRASRAPIVLLYPYRVNDNSIVAPVPETIIDRIQWMSRGAPLDTFYDLWDSRSSQLLSVLLNEAQEATFDPRRLVPGMMETITERPLYLQLLVSRAQHAPALLADMLMVPATCPLACSVIASWDVRGGGGWNRQFQAAANDSTALMAFEDAVAVLGGHLDAGQVGADELAALYERVYQLASDPQKPPRHETQLALLREEIAAAPSGIQDSVVAALLARAIAARSSMSPFCAALNLASEGGCKDRIDATAVVSTYIDVLIPQDAQLGIKQMDLKDACTLATLALKSDAMRGRFLCAVDVQAWLQAGSRPHQQYSFKEFLARRIRLHIRLLSRAIAGWPTDVPAPLVEALAAAVWAGATDHRAQGRVDAFALEIGHGQQWQTQERPIALDLAAALRRLEGTALLRVIISLCQVREPVVLAGIVANTPPAVHELVKVHLLTLTPQNSSRAFLPALQARVDALLNAGFPQLAEVFIVAEREAAPERAAPNRSLSALRESLLLLFVREEWAAIASFELPDSTPTIEIPDANDLLRFFKALAELRKPRADPAAAEAIFLALTQRHPGVATYHTNLFASRVQRLLARDALAQLSGDDLSQAKRYLSEAQREVRPLVMHSMPDLNSLDSNRAMLLLAAGQPHEALRVLQELREVDYDAHNEAFRALALARIGSEQEARALLTHAEQIFGPTDLFSAIRENIGTHRPFATAPRLSLTDDPVPGLRQAFDAFARLDHVEQAKVLQPRGQLDLYLLQEVRKGCASLVDLAPQMKKLDMLQEDDISAFLRQILLSRFSLQKWAVELQPPGGYSKRGGVGKRDLVIKYDSVELSVIEALVVDSVETTTLTSHFKKLPGYSTCQVFFHVTYVRRGDCTRIIDHLKAACLTPPAGIQHVRTNRDLPNLDSRPSGFSADYKIDSRDVTVVFLVLNMGQSVQKAAAAAQ